ncbi:response regulator transcription factor [Nocardioides sp. GCM10027113]|uniref:response regulator transcription factor n=1 Tax=unclassified Nocardioides TaxID=2615069 RepID=UPI003621DBDC
MNVGVCEDDPVIRDVLVRGLRHLGHDVVAAHDGAEAIALFVGSPLDAVVLDIGLPDSDGRDVCLALRASGQAAPVLFLTALGETHDVLAGFGAGADDYVAKPVELSVLAARLEALARRAPREVGDDSLALDPRRHAVRTPGGEALLSPTEFRMLALLLGRRGEVVRRREVLAAGWPDGAIVQDNTVDAFVHKIRKKLASVEAPVTVETVRGVGYRVPDDRG